MFHNIPSGSSAAPNATQTGSANLTRVAPPMPVGPVTTANPLLPPLLTQAGASTAAPRNGRHFLNLPNELLDMIARAVESPKDRVLYLRTAKLLRAEGFYAYRQEVFNLSGLADNVREQFIRPTKLVLRRMEAEFGKHFSTLTQLGRPRAGMPPNIGAPQIRQALRRIEALPERLPREALLQSVLDTTIAHAPQASITLTKSDFRNTMTAIGLTDEQFEVAVALEITVADLVLLTRWLDASPNKAQSVVEALTGHTGRAASRVPFMLYGQAAQQEHDDLTSLMRLAQVNLREAPVYLDVSARSLSQLATGSAAERYADLFKRNSHFPNPWLMCVRDIRAVNRAVARALPPAKPSDDALPAITAACLRTMDAWLSGPQHGAPDHPASLTELLTSPGDVVENTLGLFYAADARSEVHSLTPGRFDLDARTLHDVLQTIRRELQDTILTARTISLRDTGYRDDADAARTLETLDSWLKKQSLGPGPKCLFELALCRPEQRDATLRCWLSAPNVGDDTDAPADVGEHAHAAAVPTVDGGRVRRELKVLAAAGKVEAHARMERQVACVHGETELCLLLMMTTVRGFRHSASTRSNVHPVRVALAQFLRGGPERDFLMQTVNTDSACRLFGLDDEDPLIRKNHLTAIGYRALDRFREQLATSLCETIPLFCEPGGKALYEGVREHWCELLKDPHRDDLTFKHLAGASLQAHSRAVALCRPLSRDAAERTAVDLWRAFKSRDSVRPVWELLARPLPSEDWVARALSTRSAADVRALLPLLHSCISALRVKDGLRVANQLARTAIETKDVELTHDLGNRFAACFRRFALFDLPASVVDVLSSGPARLNWDNVEALAYIRKPLGFNVYAGWTLPVPYEAIARFALSLAQSGHSIKDFAAGSTAERTGAVDAYVDAEWQDSFSPADWETSLDSLVVKVKWAELQKRADHAESRDEVIELLREFPETIDVTFAPVVAMVADSLALGIGEYLREPGERSTACRKLSDLTYPHGLMPPQLILQIQRMRPGGDLMPMAEPSIGLEPLKRWSETVYSREQALRMFRYLNPVIGSMTNRDLAMDICDRVAVVALRTFSRAELLAASRQMTALVGHVHALPHHAGVVRLIEWKYAE